MTDAVKPGPSAGKPRQVLIAGWVLFWLLMIAVAVQDDWRSGGQQWWRPVFWETSSALGITLLGGCWLHLTRRNAERLLDQPRRWFIYKLRWLPALIVMFVLLVYGVRHAVLAMIGLTYEHAPWGQVFVYEAVKLSLFGMLFVTIEFGLRAYASLLAQNARLAQAEQLATQARLESLSRQIQPHFLFNALNSIVSVVHAEPDRAERLLLRLSDLLRAALQAHAQATHTVAEEMAALGAYCELMQERFSDRVNLNWQLAPEAMPCRIPVNILQPLVENVFKHTVERRSLMVGISIETELDQGCLLVRVRDDQGVLDPVQQMHAQQGGLGGQGGWGLRNIRERLQAHYGEAASLTVQALSPKGVESELRVPCAS